MIPRTVLMAQEVAAQFTTSQLEDYGNIILNGYSDYTTGVSTAGAQGAIASLTLTSGGTNYTNGTYTKVYLGGSVGTFGYATVVVAGGIVTTVTLTAGGRGFYVGQVLTLGNIPRTAPGTTATVTVASVNQYSVQPALKGWTTNYQEYYTQLQPNGYNVNPGDPTMFEYTVHSFTQGSGPIASVCGLQGGSNYTTGTHTNVPTVGGSGTGATLDLTIGVGGVVTSAVLNNPGTGYTVGDGLTVTTLGAGYGFAIFVCGIVGGVGDVTITNGGSGYTPGTYPATPLTGGSGAGATANVTVSPTVSGVTTGVLLLTGGTGYATLIAFTNTTTVASVGTGSGLVLSGTTDGTGAVDSVIIGSSAGSGYAVNDVVQVNGTSGTKATVRITSVGSTGAVTGLTIVSYGNGYEQGDILTLSAFGGSGLAATVTAIVAPSPAGQYKWAQPPHRLINAQVADFVPPGPNQQAIQYSAILYPVPDNPIPPPIDIL